MFSLVSADHLASLSIFQQLFSVSIEVISLATFTNAYSPVITIEQLATLEAVGSSSWLVQTPRIELRDFSIRRKKATLPSFRCSISSL